MLGQTLVNGLLLGGVYGVATIGFSMVWGVMSIINLAHGAYIMMGAYFAYVLATSLGIDPFLSMPLVMAAMFCVGWAVQRFLLNPVMRTSVLLTLAVTFGLDLFLVDLFVAIFTSDIRSVNTAYSSASLAIGPVLVPYVRLAAALLSLVLAGLLYLVLTRAKLGQAILATALDREAARLMGIFPERIYAITSGMGAALAGAAGSLASELFPISPGLGTSFIGAVFVITVLGGIGSVTGAVAAGFVYALIQSFAASYLGVNYQEIVAFGLFLAILVLRPQGLFGRRFFGEI